MPQGVALARSDSCCRQCCCVFAVARSARLGRTRGAFGGPSRRAASAPRSVMRSVNIGGNRYGSLVGAPWGEIFPDAIGAFGVVVAASAAWLSQRVSSRSVSVSKTVAAIEQDRRNNERVPRLSARLETSGSRTERVRAQRLARILRASGLDQSRSARGPQHGLPARVQARAERRGQRASSDARGGKGSAPAWQTDTLHPLAQWDERMAPGTSALWLMELRRTADISAGSDGVRFKALARAERDNQSWELPLPVSITDNASALINEAAAKSGR